MVKEYRDKSAKARFIMHKDGSQLKGLGLHTDAINAFNTFVFNKGKEQNVQIDDVVYTMPPNSLLPLVANQNFSFEYPEELAAWQFNREFYCIVEHDVEVSCVGFLFYGIHHPMFIHLSPNDVEMLRLLEKQCSEEFVASDRFQGEMLRTLLKSLIIRATRSAKKQCQNYQAISDDKMDLVRKFSLLLEGSFKQEHQVKYYASALNKSPKTLSNIFALLSQPSPSKLIQNRIILEAKRLLRYTHKTAKEITYELGFESPAHFSRFFKLCSGVSISAFRDR